MRRRDSDGSLGMARDDHHQRACCRPDHLRLYPIRATEYPEIIGLFWESDMSKTAMIRARMEPALKKHAEQVLAKVGLSPTEAIRLFYRQVSLHKGLPFAVRMPNAATRAAMAEARAPKKLKAFKSAADMIGATRA